MNEEVMTFPSTLDEFIKEYSFIDKKEVYTNGNELIQVFRIKQWEEHKRNIWDQLKQHLIDLFNESQETFYLDVLQIMEEFERGNNANTSN